MLSLKQYLLSIISAAILVSITTRMIPSASKHRPLIQMIGGIMIILTIVAPLTKLRVDDYISFYNDISTEAEDQVAWGKNSASNAVRQVIKEQSEAYILEKAAVLGADIQAEIILDAGDQPYPVYVEIQGNISPYAKKQLRSIICNDIGIPEERQKWT